MGMPGDDEQCSGRNNCGLNVSHVSSGRGTRKVANLQLRE